MGAFLGDGRRPTQFGVNGTVRFCERMDDFLRGILGDDLGRVGFSIGVFENEPRFARFNKLAVGRSRKEDAAGRNCYETGGKGSGFRHKERHISSRSAACATGFSKKSPAFFLPLKIHLLRVYGNYKQNASTDIPTCIWALVNGQFHLPIGLRRPDVGASG